MKSKIRRQWFFFGSAWLLGLGSSLVRAGQDTATKITRATGPWEVQPALWDHWVAAEEGELVLAGDLVRTLAGATGEVACPDGTRLTLAPETTLDFRQLQFEAQGSLQHLEFVLWRGQVAVQVPPLGAGTFRAQAPHLGVVLPPEGAAFTLHYQKGQPATVEVLQGRVFVDQEGRPEELAAGERWPRPSEPKAVSLPSPILDESTQVREANGSSTEAAVGSPKPKPTETTSEPPEAAAEASTGRASAEPGHDLIPAPETPVRSEREEAPLLPTTESPTDAPTDAPAEIPAEVWDRMPPGERATLWRRLQEMAAPDRAALRQMSLEDWTQLRAAAQVAECQTHLRLLWSAFRRYAADHEGRFPPADGWRKAIFPYLEAGASWECSAEGNEENWDYQFNSALAGVLLTAIRQPALTIVAYEGHPTSFSDQGEPQPLMALHGEGFNVLFANGQVRWMKLPLYRNVRWQP